MIKEKLAKYRHKNTPENMVKLEVKELIGMIRNKNNPDDIFYNTRIDGVRVTNPISGQRKVEQRTKKYDLMKKYRKLNLVINLKSFHQQNYIRCVLAKIDISKQLFVEEVALGQSIFIPKDLS